MGPAFDERIRAEDFSQARGGRGIEMEELDVMAG